VIYQDYNGRSQAKSVPKPQFKRALENGIVFARANLDFNFQDHMAGGVDFMADSGDMLAVPDPRSYAVIPYHPETARIHATLHQDDNSSWEGCPRTRLQRMIEHLAEHNLSVAAAFEPEFILFEKTADGEYKPAGAEGMFTVDGLDRHYDLMQKIINTCESMGVRVTQLGKEYGYGQYEGSTLHGDPITAVDNYLTLKEVVRASAREDGLVASFMPKPYAHLPGNGLHVHMSLWDLEGNNDLGKGEWEDEPLSQLGKHFVGGLLKHAPALTVGSPIVNSYKRLLPGSWSPAHICWGVGNRAALIRIPSMSARRFEYRSGDNAANPYIFLTCLLAAGLDGIENKITPPDPVEEDVGHLSADECKARELVFLPRTLPEALAAFESNTVLACALGPVIHPGFIKVKRSELDAYNLHVHPWERETYLEAL
jgi:glutamine synthetase